MTALQMKEEFLVGYDRVANLAAPGYTNEEISLFLSEAQEMLVKTKYNPIGNKYQEGFEETEKRRKDLSAVTVNGTGIISADQDGVISENSVIYNLPDNHWLTTLEWVETDDSCKPTKVAIPITQDEYFNEKDNPFRKPNEERVWRLDSTSLNGITRHEIIKGTGYNINNYKLRYIKKLADIDIDSNITSELHPMTHREIVKLAVTIALENQQDPRSQTNAQLGERIE
jgi:hypothetical protein